jgi:hypothetical protein
MLGGAADTVAGAADTVTGAAGPAPGIVAERSRALMAATGAALGLGAVRTVLAPGRVVVRARMAPTGARRGQVAARTVPAPGTVAERSRALMEATGAAQGLGAVRTVLAPGRVVARALMVPTGAPRGRFPKSQTNRSRLCNIERRWRVLKFAVFQAVLVRVGALGTLSSDIIVCPNKRA